MAYYYAFVERYPGIRQMADATEDEVLKLWQGLGYYSRARNMLHTAQFVTRQLNGSFPSTAKEIQKLKGIGPYTAAAIASIAFNEPIAAVDGNVLRVISRFFGIQDPVDKPDGRSQVDTLANEYLNRLRPGDFNQAIMDLGSQVCKPRNPLCSSCPIQKDCMANALGLTDKIPMKQGKTKVSEWHLDYLVLTNKGHIAMKQRTRQGVWKNLWDFPETNISSPTVRDEFPEIPSEISHSTQIPELLATFSHKLSHRDITARFFLLHISNTPDTINGQNVIWTPKKRFGELAVPILIEKFWSKHQQNFD